jgi:L-aminopeptidase/D-esterase-like protein
MTRRTFLATSSIPLLPADGGASQGTITEVEGVKVGHWTETRRPTGCTVILVEEGAIAAIEQRGGAPGTRETNLLDPANTVEQVHAVLLAGGSAFGLSAADGVMRYLEEKGIGYPARPGVRVPIVPAAILFDLGLGNPKIRPTAESGYKACQAAGNQPPLQGNFGAGAGATIGKMFGAERAMKGGFGTASVRLPNGIVVGAAVAANPVGDVWDHVRGKIVAGARTADGKRLADTMAMLRRGELPPERPRPAEHTTIAVVATNLALTKAETRRLAIMAADGLPLAIRPAHLPADGDTVFALATGKRKVADSARWMGIAGALAADVLAQAIVSAALNAKGIPGYPAAGEIQV